MKSIIQFLSSFKVIVFLFSAIAVIATAQAYFDSGNTEKLTDYNNYVIFKQSFFHLIDNKDLYILYPDEYWDLYKYSPTFSLFFGLFAYLPDITGLICWNLLNTLLLVFGVWYIPNPAVKKKNLMLLACLIEMFTAIQNEQSNGLIAGLLVVAYALMERKHFFFAAFCIVFSIYIKLFGVVALALFLFYPQKIKISLYVLFWMVLLFVVPLFVISFEQYHFIILSWGEMLANDHSTSLGYSIMGWLESWFGMGNHKLIVLIIGIILFCIPLMKFSAYRNNRYRLLLLSSILLWIVIFNHKAESPTFIIAVTGISIWFFNSERNYLNSSLFAIAIIFTSLSGTDVFPPFIRNNWFGPYVIKAVPCILIWFKIMYDLIVFKSQNTSLELNRGTI